NDGRPKDYAGEPFNFTPKWSGAVLANYLRPIGEQLTFTAGADYSYTQETNAQLGDDRRFDQPAYSIVNARLGIGGNDARWTATLFARNVFDKYYVLGVFNPGDTIGRYTGQPRNYGLTFSYRWF